MTKKYLVTGGTGFIGAALVKRLLQEGNPVRVIDNNYRGSLNKLGALMHEIDFIEADIRDRDKVVAAANGMDSIIHLAYINGTEFFYKQPEIVLDVAIRGMLNVIDACRIQGIGEMILASSSEVYQTPPLIPTNESVPLSVPDVMNPRYSYGGGKLACELMAVNYGRSSFDRLMIFRPHNVYGPDMGFEHVLPQFILRALDAIQNHHEDPVPFPIQGDGKQTRAFIHIDDFIDGLMTILKYGRHLDIYHIGNPEEKTIKHTAQKVFQYFGREAEIIAGPLPEGGTPRRCPDITRIAQLGFKPRVSFEHGLPTIADWYADYWRRNQGKQNSIQGGTK